MKKLNKLYSILTVVGLLAFSSCETIELELLTSPNGITEESADPNFVLNDVQLTFNGIHRGYSGPSRSITRQTYMFGTYNQTVDENTLSGEWANSYQMFENIEFIEAVNDADIADGGPGYPLHLGIAYTLEAFSYMLLVDYLGDVPFSEAGQPNEFPSPRLDPGSDVYAAQVDLLDLAIQKLGEGEGAPIPTDLYAPPPNAEFNADKWIAIANTLKLRAFINTKNTAGISSLLSSNIINTIDEDFEFYYGTQAANPSSINPLFSGNYGAGGAGGRLSNYLFDIMNVGSPDGEFIENGVVDPRTRYYFYRQTDADPSGSNIPCAGNNAYDYCYVGNGYWGRDHADDEGLPNDGFNRPVTGVYPAGGTFDKDQFVQARTLTETDQGAGITPIYLSSYTHFALAEAALTLNVGGNALSLMQQGIRLSMEKVSNFTNQGTDGLGMTQADIDDYVNRVTTEYNAANANGKLEIIAREYFIAAWGNGVEPYNTYRRTGFPDVQSPIFPAGSFPRTFQYPDTETGGNPNIQPKPLTATTFWDTNPQGFID